MHALHHDDVVLGTHLWHMTVNTQAGCQATCAHSPRTHSTASAVARNQVTHREQVDKHTHGWMDAQPANLQNSNSSRLFFHSVWREPHNRPHASEMPSQSMPQARVCFCASFLSETYAPQMREAATMASSTTALHIPSKMNANQYQTSQLK